MINLQKGDCLELMKDIPDKGIDMILCYSPYGVTRNKCDNVLPFNLLWEQYHRVIKENGAIVLNCQQPFTTKLIALNINEGETVLDKLIKIQKDGACPDNELSTILHELFHWKDAQEYIKYHGTITIDNYDDYIRHLNTHGKECKFVNDVRLKKNRKNICQNEERSDEV